MLKDDKIYEQAVAEIQKRYGKESLNFFNSNAENKFPAISTGSLKLDKVLGIGGLPQGRIIEIYGNESSGKTTLALQTIAQCQKSGGKAAYIDAEHALDPSYAKNLGIDLQTLLVAHPQHGEQAFSVIEALVKTNMIDLIVVDSVAALVPKAELEGTMEDQVVGLHARMMSKGLRRLQSFMANSNTCIVFINQIREKIGIMFGNPETTPGGRALLFYSSVRLEVRRSELLRDENQHVGIKSKVTVVKNKVAPPLGVAYIEIYFNKGVNYRAEIIDFAVQYGIIEKAGSWYSFNSNKLCQGRENLLKLIENDNTLFSEIETLTLTKATPVKRPKSQA
ncbi:recombinase RecA [[Mycoplasma] testudinis]|uniref:recombinase RecA n=1 Tax=[Mycoplasma] testudinis TaxID=33924 RepID=UPI000AAA54AA|nr:recombinase RecA [[Mycoplasma] testudinis]